ncbi:MAG: hypothetical protein HZB53_04645 [Chloroflexi bacterium]|nr:hypothetical protein [Chloroflexota bacterium]
MKPHLRLIVTSMVALLAACALAALLDHSRAPALAAPTAGAPLVVKIITPTAPLTIPGGKPTYVSATVSGEGVWAGAYFYFATEATGGLDNWLQVWYPNAAAPYCVPYPQTDNFWTPPSTQLTHARVRVDLVSDCINPTVVASNTGDLFTVEPIQIYWLRPRNNELLRPGTVYPLRWGLNDTFTVVDHFWLSYSLDGTNFGLLPGTAGLRLGNSFPWTVFPTTTTTLYLRVEACAQGEFCQNSLGAATVGPLRVSSDPNEKSLFLTYPANGPDPNGETPVFFYNRPEEVWWGSTGNPTNLYLQYSIDGGSTFPGPQVFGDCMTNSGKKTWTPPELNSTQAVMRLSSRVDCTGGATLLEDFSMPFIISINSWNRRPYANAGNFQTALEGTPVTLDGSASSDRDGDSLNYQWSLLQSYPVPLSVTLNLSRSAIANFVAPSVQTTATLSFQLQVDDGPANPAAPLGARDRVQVTIAPAPPVVNSVSPTCGNVGTRFALQGSNLAGGQATIGGTVAGTFGSDNVLTATVPNFALSGPLGLHFNDGRDVSLPYSFTVVYPQIGGWSLTQNFQDYGLIWRKDTLAQIFPAVSGPVLAGCALNVDAGSMRIRRTNGYSVTLSAVSRVGPLPVEILPLTTRHLTESVNIPIRAQDLNFPLSELAGIDFTLYQNGLGVASTTIPTTSLYFVDMPNNLRILTVFLMYEGSVASGYAPLSRDWQAGIKTFLRAYPLPNVDMRTFLWPPAVWTTDELVDLSDCFALTQRFCRRNNLGEALEDFRNDWNDTYQNVPGRTATHVQMLIAPSAQDPGSNSAGVGWAPGTGNSFCRAIQNSCWERVSLVFSKSSSPTTGPIMAQEVAHDIGLVDGSDQNCCKDGAHSRYKEDGANSKTCVDTTSFAQAEVDQNLKDVSGTRGRLVIGIGLSSGSPLEFENDPARAACASNQAKSIMAYVPGMDNDNAFLEPFDYDKIEGNLLSGVSISYGPTHAPLTTQDFFISGSIDRSGLVTAGLSRLLPSVPLSVPLTHTSPYTLAFFDSGGLLSAYPIAVLFTSAHGDDSGVGVFSARWPFPPTTTRIEIHWNGATIWSRTVSAHAPVVNVLTPAGGESFSASQPISIAWGASDGDGDPLHYNLAFSADGGATFSPIFVGITRTQVLWHSLVVPATAQGVIRVEASDGILTGFGLSGQFAVAPHPPIASILDPLPGAVFHQGDTVLLRGAALTPEDGFVPDDHLSWTASPGGALGAGGQLHTAALAPGQHVITLTAVSPSSGLSTTEAITLEIVSRNQWADVTLGITGTVSAHASERVTYTVTYDNHGNFAARAGRIKVRFPWLPADLSVAGPTPFPQIDLDQETGMPTLVWDAGDIAPGGHGTLVFSLRTSAALSPGADAAIAARAEHLSPQVNASSAHALMTTHVTGRLFLPVIRH